MKFGIANLCYVCKRLTKKVKWIKGRQVPLCDNCEKEHLEN